MAFDPSIYMPVSSDRLGCRKGKPEVLKFEPELLAFSGVDVGATSAALELKITNQGDEPIGVGAPIFSGAFEVIGDLPASIEPAGSVTLAVVYKPTNNSLSASWIEFTAGTIGYQKAVMLVGVTSAEIIEGIDGDDGLDGKSAYELAKDAGYTGTLLQWISSLKGTNGKSAYELAKTAGYTGSLEEWLVDLEGTNGTNGLTAYQVAQANGYQGTQAQWLTSLKGEPGLSIKGDRGARGPESPYRVGSFFSRLVDVNETLLFHVFGRDVAFKKSDMGLKFVYTGTPPEQTINLSVFLSTGEVAGVINLDTTGGVNFFANDLSDGLYPVAAGGWIKVLGPPEDDQHAEGDSFDLPGTFTYTFAEPSL